jgi:hypothetical protein
LEIRLGCHLQVIHVPGIVMINQGTNGLSQGIWMTTLQGLADPRRLTQAVFHCLTFDRGLVLPYVQHLQVTKASQQVSGNTAPGNAVGTPTTSLGVFPSGSCHPKALDRLFLLFWRHGWKCPLPPPHSSSSPELCPLSGGACPDTS